MPRERNVDYNKIANTISEKCKHGKWKLFIIAAEGAKTEIKYFNALKERYKENFNSKNIHVECLEKENPTHSGSSTVSQILKNFYTELENKYGIQEYDEFWIVIDTDDYENRKEVIKKIAADCEQSNNYRLALSNPCFEVWLICHFVGLDAKVNECLKDSAEEQTLQEYIESIGTKGRPKTCKTIFTQLHQNERIGNLYESLIDRIPEAIPRAKKLGKCSLDPDRYPQKICTNLYKLFENLGYPEITS